MSIDIYDPRAMAQALMQMKPPRSFLRQMMIRRDEFYNVENVDVDVKSGARRLAPFVNPNKGPGKVMDRIGFTTSSIAPPMVAPKRPITITDLQKRMPGEHAYSPQSPDERAALLLGQDLAELDEDITRVEEWMCARVAFDSAVRCLGDDVDITVTFPRTAELTVGLLGAADRWSASTANIPRDIRTWRRQISRLTGLTPDYLLLGETAADTFLAAPSLVGLTGILNTQRMDLGLIKPELRESGATYLGTFAGTGIDIWAYDEWYIDPADGVEKPMVPAKSALMGCSKGYTVMRYGAVGVASGVDAQAQLALVAGRRVPESWVSKEPAVRVLKVSARPLVVPVQNDAYLTAQVIA